MSSWKAPFIRRETIFVCRICGHREKEDSAHQAWTNMLAHVGEQHPEYRVINRPKLQGEL